MTNGYEFSEEQNRRINVIRMILLHVSLLMIGVGILLLFLGHRLSDAGIWVATASGVLFVVMGVVYYQTLVGLRRVIKTAANDIGHMMVAMDNLGTAFYTGTIVVILLSLVVFAFIVALLL